MAAYATNMKLMQARGIKLNIERPHSAAQVPLSPIMGLRREKSSDVYIRQSAGQRRMYQLWWIIHFIIIIFRMFSNTFFMRSWDLIIFKAAIFGKHSGENEADCH